MPSMPTCVALVDCNNFFASCERMADPGLEQVPVAVLSSNDGCIIARSEEVKELGVPMGAPWFQWRDFLKEHQVRLFSLNMRLYTETSARIMNLLMDRVPRVQVYSIDEAFLDLSGMERYFDLDKFLQNLRQEIWQEVGVPVSIGVAPTKVLAKLANRIAKKKKTTYVEFLNDVAEREVLLKETPVEKIWGVGRRNAQRLHGIGVKTAWDLACLRPQTLQRMRSVIEGRLVLELRGQSCVSVEEPPEVKKHIGSSRSFGQPITTLPDLKGAFTFMMHMATQKLIRQRSACKTIVITAYIGRPRHPDRSKARALVTLPEHSHYPPALLKAALKKLEEVFEPGTRYYKAGVVLLDLCSIQQLKSNLFFDIRLGRQEYVLNLMQQLNRNHTKPKLEWASFKSVAENNPWEPRCDQMSVDSLRTLDEDELSVTRPWW